MNVFDDKQIAEQSFAFRDLLGIDSWESFVVVAILTVVGTPTYVGRYRIVGKQCFFEISAVSSTSIASTAGTHYFNLPIAAKGVAGFATMTDNTTKIAAGTGVCHIDIATSRCYVPTQAASANTFLVAGNYEIG